MSGGILLANMESNTWTASSHSFPGISQLRKHHVEMQLKAVYVFTTQAAKAVPPLEITAE